MTDAIFPGYIPRAEEHQVREQAELVRQDHRSRAVLLQGLGGVGKTSLIRELAATGAGNPQIHWLAPVDVDDSEYWLLSNLERSIARQLDPEAQYFGAYLDYLSRLPIYPAQRIGYNAVVSHLSRIKRIFLECYTHFIEDSGNTVVITFDSVEAIRGLYLLVTLTQWMKALPGTLFILSGRPIADESAADPIRSELENPHQHIPVATIDLGGFTREAAYAYLDNSGIAAGLTREEKEILVLLTRGHPLWLAFTVDYLDKFGLPEEAAAPLARIEGYDLFTYGMSRAGHRLHEQFIRRLVAPYRDSDFWHEAIKRLAVVRESVSQPIWHQLMADRPGLARGADLGRTWEELLQAPWIEPRASLRYVTLHDAVADELARRVIPLHDQGRHWRHEQWRRAVRAYGNLITDREAELNSKLADLDKRLAGYWDASQAADESSLPATEETALIDEAAQLDVAKRELGQLQAARLYYEILCDFAHGCDRFLAIFEIARHDHDILFQELLAFEMQRFLPGRGLSYAAGDVTGEMVAEFRQWIANDGSKVYLKIGLVLADFLLVNEQPSAAHGLLVCLPVAIADGLQDYRWLALLGNACMRIPGRARDGRQYFDQALEAARHVQGPHGATLVAAAFEELGFYFRNAGQWLEADLAYRRAHDAVSESLTPRSSEADREEMASIQTNWAYIKGLNGMYHEGTALVESAITVRHRLNDHQGEGASWSVYGEICRYARRFEKAWEAYARAEQIFQDRRNWSRLGLVYQEQAICLFQAMQDGISLVPDSDPVTLAKRLIILALDLCSDHAVRGYPSALNRAGRIFGHGNADDGLRYLAEGIAQARRLSDGWFWFANLIEYAELSYQAWTQTSRQSYRDQIVSVAASVAEVMSEYEFPDLRGRWKVLHGHLGIHDWLTTGDQDLLSAALKDYTEGFAYIAQEHVGSSGAPAIPREFTIFRQLFARLPDNIRTRWHDELRRAWSDPGQESILLLARLEELF